MHFQAIAIGIIRNEQGKILVTQRNKDAHLPNVWEFPGGKLEAGESFKQGLRREIHEEVGVNVRQCAKLIDFNYAYEDRELSFQVFTVIVHSNEVHIPGQQNIAWVDPQDLSQLDFPSANQIIINAINLPQSYMIADLSVLGDHLLEKVKINLENGVSLIQFRAPSINKEQYLAIADELCDLCHQKNARLILNGELDWFRNSSADGIHLNSQRLAALHNAGQRPVDGEIYSASCHTTEELEYANSLGVRTAIIGPVLQTPSHPQSRPLGWPQFSRLCTHANIPVYAIGGLGKKELQTAQVNGAHGIAGIRDFCDV